jgi:hypothetical protein
VSRTRYFTCHADIFCQSFAAPFDMHADFWHPRSGASHFPLPPQQQRCFLLPRHSAVFPGVPLWTLRSVPTARSHVHTPNDARAEQCSAAIPTLCFSPTHHSLFLLYFRHTLSPLTCPRVPAFSLLFSGSLCALFRTVRPVRQSLSLGLMDRGQPALQSHFRHVSSFMLKRSG